MNAVGRNIFVGALLVSLVAQAWYLIANPIDDQAIWTLAAQTVHTESPKTFPALDAYMHPGGTDIEGTIAIRSLTHISYANALNILLILVDSLAIAAMCCLCYVLRKNILWPLTALGIMTVQLLPSSSSLYLGTTPPSLIVTFVVPLWCLYTWYLYEKKDKARVRDFALWSMLAGFCTATRIDVGGLMTLAFLIFYMTQYPLRKVFLMGLGSVLIFCVFDPFMWFAPVTQVKGLFSAMATHYSGSGYSSFMYYVAYLERIIALPLLSLFLGIIFVLFRKEIKSPIPPVYLTFLLLATGIISSIFLTANAQASRYLIPLIFLWEILLPLFIFTLIAEMPFSFVKSAAGKENARKVSRAGISVLLVCLPVITYLQSVLAHTTHAL